MITVKHSTKKHLRRMVAYALFAGALAAPFAASPVYALPVEGTHHAANAAEATITQSGTVMNIVGKDVNNILKWEDFSIDAGEKVRFDAGAPLRNYLNLVTGEGMSRIYGTMEGGWNVYLVNPHGILFAGTAKVNTGALYLSTAKTEDLNTSVFRGGGQPSQWNTTVWRCPEPRHGEGEQPLHRGHERHRPRYE